MRTPLLLALLAGCATDVGTETDPLVLLPPSTTHAIWFDDAFPPGSAVNGNGAIGAWQPAGGSRPAAPSGVQIFEQGPATGLAQAYFTTTSLGGQFVVQGDRLFADVYIDPASPPSELMIQILANGTWNRAYWGANALTWGTDDTPSRRYIGPLPPAGRWQRLEVPLADLGLATGNVATGFALTQQDGHVFWDRVGTETNGSLVVLDDAVPTGTAAYGNWLWANDARAYTAPTDRQSSAALFGNPHQHYFQATTWTGIPLAADDQIVAYAQIDPRNPPSELMVQVFDGRTWNRGFFGPANFIGWPATPIGQLPLGGKWARLAIPASMINMTGKTMLGMAFTAYGGAVAWDRASVSKPPASSLVIARQDRPTDISVGVPLVYAGTYYPTNGGSISFTSSATLGADGGSTMSGRFDFDGFAYQTTVTVTANPPGLQLTSTSLTTSTWTMHTRDALSEFANVLQAKFPARTAMVNGVLQNSNWPQEVLARDMAFHLAVHHRYRDSDNTRGDQQGGGDSSGADATCLTVLDANGNYTVKCKGDTTPPPPQCGYSGYYNGPDPINCCWKDPLTTLFHESWHDSNSDPTMMAPSLTALTTAGVQTSSHGGHCTADLAGYECGSYWYLGFPTTLTEYGRCGVYFGSFTGGAALSFVASMPVDTQNCLNLDHCMRLHPSYPGPIDNCTEETAAVDENDIPTYEAINVATTLVFIKFQTGWSNFVNKLGWAIDECHVQDNLISPSRASDF